MPPHPQRREDMPKYKFDLIYTTSKYRQHEVEASSLIEARSKIHSWFLDEDTSNWYNTSDADLDIELVETINAP
jgi:hypothetical protein